MSSTGRFGGQGTSSSNSNSVRLKARQGLHLMRTISVPPLPIQTGTWSVLHKVGLSPKDPPAVEVCLLHQNPCAHAHIHALVRNNSVLLSTKKP
ncbi:hypothetical protein TgHK011_000520 [Trichoderma gracile]|nr:hypothetical protein TgHK011_000520 [Trichoderma gracile]